MLIKKASGKLEEYSRTKLERSLRRSGASLNEAKLVGNAVERRLRPEMTTKELYELANRELRKIRPLAAASYSIRQAIMELGPEGFLFEKFIAALLREYGYTTKKGTKVQGKCVSHEIDVIAEKGKEVFLIELKYHNKRGIRSDVQTTMYLYARFLDINAVRKGTLQPWLMTNTKFTTSAVRYAECMGVRMTGWRYPLKSGLYDLIEEKGLHPVTVLPSVNRFVRDRLAEKGILFVKDLRKITLRDMELRLGIEARVAQRMVEEVKALA